MIAGRERAEPAGTPVLADGHWTNVVDPDDGQIDDLEHQLGIPPIFLRHALDSDELARMEKQTAATLIVLRIPYVQGPAAPIPYITVPLGIILTAQHIVTICKWHTGVVQDARVRQAADAAPAQLERIVLQLLLSTADQYLSHVRDITVAVDALEARLQHSLSNREVVELLRYQKSLTHFRTALQLNEMLLERLQQDPLLNRHPEDAELVGDALTEIRQALVMTTIASDILSQMMDAFASIISNNLNVVMKFLATSTIVLTFPMMIASFYGMNVALPGADAPAAFGVTIAVSLIVSLVVAAIFWKKVWL